MATDQDNTLTSTNKEIQHILFTIQYMKHTYMSSVHFSVRITSGAQFKSYVKLSQHDIF